MIGPAATRADSAKARSATPPGGAGRIRVLASARPRINGARVIGVRPGSPVLHTIAATGERPIAFSAEGLPRGLRIDAGAGRISGSLDRAGEHEVTLRARNRLGACTQRLRIVIGERICLTPPMGWNSWNVWGRNVDEAKIRQAAEAMVSTGLIHHGWSYINIDDGWQGERDLADGRALSPNTKFPDVHGLCEHVHALGLKVGIYSTPWVKSFAGFRGGSSGQPRGPIRDRQKGWYVGAETFEPADARQWAAWGIDYLKYDWNPMDLESGRRMRAALRACGRDIVFNATNSAPEEDFAAWAELAECYYLWRRADQGDGDIKDNWKSVSSIGFRMSDWAVLSGPGRWNDPDMLVLGQVGWGEGLRPCGLSPDEQYTHMSLWCLLSAPLLLGCDLTNLDDFTLGLLTNDEVIDVNQDPLGRSARRVAQRGRTEVWAKPMESGAVAVGLFNRDEAPRACSAFWHELGIEGPRSVRDLWRQKDLGGFGGVFEATVPSHGVLLVRMDPAEGDRRPR